MLFTAHLKSSTRILDLEEAKTRVLVAYKQSQQQTRYHYAAWFKNTWWYQCQICIRVFWVFVSWCTVLNNWGNIRINVTLRRVWLKIFAVEKQYYVFLVCVCSLTYPACKQHAPYCIVLSVLRGSTVFSTFSHKRHALPKNVSEHKMCVLIFSAPLYKIFLIPRRIQPNVITIVRSL